MTDVLTREQRSYNMSQIKNKNTKPEIRLRKLLFSQGLKGYRLSAAITGKPDIVFSKYKIVIFIDGCFWHKCPLCFKKPQTNKKFWIDKIENNVKRDRETNKSLVKDGWIVLRFWEHEIKKNINKCVSDIELEINRGGET